MTNITKFGKCELIDVGEDSLASRLAPEIVEREAMEKVGCTDDLGYIRETPVCKAIHKEAERFFDNSFVKGAIRFAAKLKLGEILIERDGKIQNAYDKSAAKTMQELGKCVKK